jgi:hypothetical protein
MSHLYVIPVIVRTIGQVEFAHFSGLAILQGRLACVDSIGFYYFGKGEPTVRVARGFLPISHSYCLVYRAETVFGALDKMARHPGVMKGGDAPNLKAIRLDETNSIEEWPDCEFEKCFKLSQSGFGMCRLPDTLHEVANEGKFGMCVLHGMNEMLFGCKHDQVSNDGTFTFDEKPKECFGIKYLSYEINQT